MFIFGPPNVEKMTAKKDVKGLIKLLKNSSDPQLRRQAVNALLQIGDRQAIEPLYEAKEDEDAPVRALAAIALGYFGDPRAVERLIATLYTGRETSVKLLSLLGGKQAVGPLIRVLQESTRSDEMTAAAAEALGTLGDERAIKVIIQELKRSNDTYKSTIVKALAAFGALAVPPLVESLKQGWRLGDEWNSVRSSVEPAFLALSAPVREALVAELDQTQNYELFVDIVAILEKMDGGLDSRKAQAARLIVKKSWAEVAEMGPEAQGILTSLLRSRLEDKNLVKTLVKIWGCNASDELINLLQDKSLSPFHEHAVEALGELGDERAIPFLAALLQSPDVSIYVREKALRAIRLFNTPPAIQALERLLELANSPTMRSAAADALDQWHWKPGSDRLRAVYLITRQEWGQFLGLARPVINQVVEDLLGLVKTRSGSVLDVIHSLGMIGDPRATEALTVILEDLDEKLRLAACEALGLIGDARALAPLEKVAKNDYYLSDDPVNNPYKYDHTGGSNDYWSSGSDEYPVRNAALRAINLITHKPPITQPEN